MMPTYITSWRQVKSTGTNNLKLTTTLKMETFGTTITTIFNFKYWFILIFLYS